MITNTTGAVRLLAAVTLVASGLCTRGAFAQADKPAITPPAPATAPAPKIDAAKEKSIRELLTVTDAAKTQGKLIGGQIVTYFQRTAPFLTPENLKSMETKFTDVAAINEQLVRLYDKHYTQADIDGLLAFYKSPVGQKMLAESFSLTQEITEVGQKWGSERADAIITEIQKERAAAQPKPPTPKPNAAPVAFDKKPFKSSGKVVKTASGLQYDDMTVGTGKVAVKGKNCVMHYTGTLKDGTVFDSSRERGEPFPFPLGAGRVIKGWDEGVAGMKVGGRRKLIIPANLGYGAAGTPGGPIPPNAVLVFDVELMDVQ